MTNYARVQKHIDHGKGKAARHVGLPYTALRLTPVSNGDFPGGWTTVSAKFSMLRRRFAEGKLEVGIKNVTLFYRIVANMNAYLLGDVFLQTDPAYDPGFSYGVGATSVPGTFEFNAMALAWHPPENEAIGGRIDRRVKIYRPSPSPATVQDGSGVAYWKETNDNDLPLIMAAGVYAFGQAGAGGASFVPAGFTSALRQHESVFEPGVPGMLKEAKWFVYVPPLPGYMPSEGDAIIDENGARYVVSVPYEQKTGVVGYQLVCDRKISSDDDNSGPAAGGDLDWSNPDNSGLLPGLN